MSPSDSSPVEASATDSPLTVTHASEADLPHLLRLEKLCISHPWTERGFLDELNHSESLLLIARTAASAAPIGYLAARRCVDEAEILRVVVDPAQRNRGAARQLLISGFRLLITEGVRAFFMEVREDNAPALGLYRSLSFRVLHRRPNYYRDGCTALVLAADSEDLGWMAAP
jgi:ribosomal-protein-alanine N-acetyltransferase